LLTSEQPEPSIVLSSNASAKPTRPTRDRTDALYAAMHKALCQLAFDLQELADTATQIRKDTTNDQPQEQPEARTVVSVERRPK
jgi:hypothetical protein